MDFVWLVKILDKYLAPSGSPGVFVNTQKHIIKLRGLCKACKILKIVQDLEGPKIGEGEKWTQKLNQKL